MGGVEPPKPPSGYATDVSTNLATRKLKSDDSSSQFDNRHRERLWSADGRTDGQTRHI